MSAGLVGALEMAFADLSPRLNLDHPERSKRQLIWIQNKSPLTACYDGLPSLLIGQARPLSESITGERCLSLLFTNIFLV